MHNAAKHIGFCSSLTARKDKYAITHTGHSVSTRALLATTNRDFSQARADENAPLRRPCVLPRPPPTGCAVPESPSVPEP